jgi:hypothetical protein
MKPKLFFILPVLFCCLSIFLARAEESKAVGAEPVTLVVDQVSDTTLIEYINRLVDFQTRYTCTDSNWAAGQWIYDKFIEFGYTDVSFDSFPFDEPGFSCDVQRNIVAVKPGLIDPDRYIILGGHYDSRVDFAECEPDSFAPGADDNASGTALTLEAARVLADQNNDITLVFIAFASEETGLGGSEHYANEAFNAGMDIRVMMNADMVAYDTDGYWEVGIYSMERSMLFYEAVEDMARTYTDMNTAWILGTGSDAQAFTENGYHTVYAFEMEFNTNAHGCYDIVEQLNMPYYAEVTELFTLSMLYFSNMPDQPTGFQVVNVGDGTSLYLSWDPNDEPDLAGYNIRYGTEPGVHDSVRTVTTTSDTLQNLVEGQTYYMVLEAIDTDGNESFATGEIGITVSSRPGTPVGVTSTSLESEIIIDWEPNGDLDLSGYNVIRRKTTGLPDTTLLGFVPAPVTDFADQTAESHTVYGYHVTAIDTEDPPAESEPSEEVFGRLATRDMGVLVVDNTLDGTGGTFTPTDEAVDEYYSEILRNYNVQAAWDVSDSLALDRAVMDYDLGIYSTVVWHSDIRGALAEPSDTMAMRKYMQVGGNLWISGWDVLDFLTGGEGPVFAFGGVGFVPKYMGIDSAGTTTGAERDFIGAESLEGDFPDIQVDPNKIAPFTGLFEMEYLVPPFSGTDSLYAYVSSDSGASEYHGLPVGVLSQSTEYGLVFTDFPLYFMVQDDAEGLVDAVMELFSEPQGIGDGDIVTHLPRAYSLSQNFPNPFNPMTTIGFEIPGFVGEQVEVSLRIYDVRGRLVRTLIDGTKVPGIYQVTWNGRNEKESDPRASL